MVSVRSNVYRNTNRRSSSNDNHRIPLPNEVSDKKDEKGEIDGKEKLLPELSLKSIFNKIKEKITLEDIILLGLAFLLLGDEWNDEILLIAIIYILIDF